MQSLSTALCRLQEDGSWFARAQELRLLAVRTTADLRKAALQTLQGLEFHADNFSPWVTLEDASTREDDGWQARANRLLLDWEQRRAAFAKEGVELPPVAAAPAPASGPAPALKRRTQRLEAPIGPLLRAAEGVVQALRPPLRGLVLVLAPAVVDDPRALEADLEILLQAPALAACRWVLVLSDQEPPKRLLSALGDRALACDCRVDPAAFERDVEALAAGSEARAGAAGPRGVVPPRRVDDPPELPRELRDQELRKAGVDPRYLDAAPRLRTLVLGAALAMKQGRAAEGVRLQREARDLCAQIELHPMKVICQIALASYLSGSNLPDQAMRELGEAVKDAQAHELPVQESQAHLAIGMLHAVAQRPAQATQAYVQAARVAEPAEMPLLAIEAWRLAGQLALQANLVPQASSAFKEAIRIASSADARLAKQSSAPEAARTLAALCRKHDLAAQADSLEEQANAFEAGTAAPPSPPTPGAGERPAPALRS